MHSARQPSKTPAEDSATCASRTGSKPNRFDAILSSSSLSEHHADRLLLIAAILGIAAVAYADSLVVTISLGYLYVLPLSLCALTQHRRISFTLVLICVALHDWLGPYEHSGWPILYRSLLTFAGFATVVLFVGKLAEQRSQLIQTVRAQRDELALELKHAAEVQQHLLPRTLPQVPAMEFAGLMSPAKELGGDYYDYIQLPQGDIGLVIADVSGKGTEAALFMPSIEVALRMGVHNDSRTDEIISNLNRVLIDLADQTRFVTLFYARLDVAHKTIQYTNAGHQPPFILRAREPALWLTEGGPVVGLLPEASFQTASVALRPGDVLVLYTDGVVDPENAEAEQFSSARLVESARANMGRTAQDMVHAIHSSVVEFAGSRELSDDFTLVVVKISPENV